jgi:hypothetical protein
VGSAASAKAWRSRPGGWGPMLNRPEHASNRFDRFPCPEPQIARMTGGSLAAFQRGPPITPRRLAPCSPPPCDHWMT